MLKNAFGNCLLCGRCVLVIATVVVVVVDAEDEDGIRIVGQQQLLYTLFAIA
jgi:hypothetical protein